MRINYENNNCSYDKKENNRLLRVTDYFLKKYLLFLLQIKKIYYIIKLSIDSFTYPERRSY